MTKRASTVPKKPISTPKPSLSIVVLSKLSKQLFEKDLRVFLAQFGSPIVNVRVSRSKKTTHSKGYAFVEFKDAQVAAIVAESLNNYFIHGRPIRAAVMTEDSIHADLFAHKKMKNLRFARQKLFRSSYAEKSMKLNRRKADLLAKKLETLGINYALPEPVVETSN
jgi:nucleolar protein 15